MKKLQNDFTTPEQSKRLLEIGVPADSANCCLRRILTDGGYCETWKVDVFDFIGQVHDGYLPCWSAGRLIEIAELCYNPIISSGREYHIMMKDCNTDYLIKLFELCADNMDFSKLED